MTETKLTPWFPMRRYGVPTRVGVYEVKVRHCGVGNRYSWWNGSYWCSTARTAAEAKARRHYGVTVFSIVCWRGILK